MKSGVYEGEFLNGSFHGMGKFTGKNGLVRYGVWHHGNFAKQLPIPKEGEEGEESVSSDEEESESEETTAPVNEESGEKAAE